MARCFTPPAENNTAVAINLAIAVAIGIIIFIRSKRTSRGLLLAFSTLLFLIIAFLPYLSLGISTHSLEGERFLYLPSIFASLLLIESISMITHGNGTRLILFFVLIAYQLFFLYAAHNNYKTASAVTRLTFNEINSLKGKKRLFIAGLPQSNKGALMFRLGLEEGVKWLKREGTVDSVIVLSLQDKTISYANDFSAVVVDIKSGRTFNKILVKGPEAVGGYVEKPTTTLVFNKDTDALFLYNDRSLSIIK
jgi:signal transduction histidine kinase